MDIENEIRRIKNKRNKLLKTDQTEDMKTYVNSLIGRSLIAIIIFFACIILTNTNDTASKFIKEEILTNNISFTKIGNIYNKYFGNILPFEKLVKDESKMVFKENLTYESIDKYKDGFVLNVPKNYLVPVIKEGVVVFIGDKEGLGNTVIIQGIDEIDYWYSNVEDVSLSLYDYVSDGTTLGVVDGTKFYMTFKKDGEFLDFDEVVK